MDLVTTIERLLPTPTSSDAASSGNQPNPTDISLTDATVRRPETFGRYTAAIEQWETLTRPAPDPTLKPGGTQLDLFGGTLNPTRRLNPRFVEWMMGLPDGHVTDLIRRRTTALRILGNGVVPQQAATAIRQLVDRLEEPEP